MHIARGQGMKNLYRAFNNKSEQWQYLKLIDIDSYNCPLCDGLLLEFSNKRKEWKCNNCGRYFEKQPEGILK